MAGKGGGAWKVAYADFVTAMMAFFLVMWIVAQNKPVKEAVAGYFKDPYGTSASAGGSGVLSGRGNPTPSTKIQPKNAKGRPASAKGKRVKAAGRPTSPADPTGPGGRQPAPYIGKDVDTTTVGDAIFFAEDSAELDEAGLSKLADLAPQLVGKPNKIEIRGHSTGRPLPEGSPYQDAWQLSYARCLATMKFLVEHGVEMRRFRLSQAGAFEPRELDTKAGPLAQNARVEIYMLGEFVLKQYETPEERSQAATSKRKKGKGSLIDRHKGKVLRGPGA